MASALSRSQRGRPLCACSLAEAKRATAEGTLGGEAAAAQVEEQQGGMAAQREQLHALLGAQEAEHVARDELSSSAQMTPILCRDAYDPQLIIV